MLKKCMIAPIVVVLTVSVVSAADTAIQAIDLCTFPVYMDVGHYVQLPEYNNCMYPVYPDAGYYVEIKDCDLRKLNLVQVDCEDIGKSAEDFPCFTGCEEIELRANFPATFGAMSSRIGPILNNRSTFWKDDDNQIDGTGDWEKLTVCMNAWKAEILMAAEPDDILLVGEITITTEVPVTFSGWVYMSQDAPDFGYYLDEDDLVFFYSFDFVYSYNSTTGGWSVHMPTDWVYFDWPFYYELDTGDLWFALPPESGIGVYHNSTGQWEVLPRIIP
ncbi:MAG: hypothetical protein ACYS6K_05255 [Planctomycetota bacterium]